MNRTIAKLIAIPLLSLIVLFVNAAPAIAQDAFSILDKLEKNYVGLEKEGLNTFIAKASVSAFPGTDITVYWSREKGLKVTTEGGGPASMGAGQMVKGYLGTAGLGIRKMSEQSKLTKETVEATAKAVTLKDGTQATELTFIPKNGQDLGFEKMVMKVDTEKWLVRQSVTTTKEGEAAADMTYEGGLLAKTVSSTGNVNITIANTFTKTDQFSVPAKQVIEMKGPDIPKEMESITITYSDIKVNTVIPEDVFAEPKPGDVQKPTETAAELFQQAQTAMMQGDMNTAKLKLQQIVTYYPDDPMSASAKMMLEQLPK
ncbi:MAG: hypothetical protein A2V66_13805 [Ignavibacteria bacterium RBG_13_36_8]|nr:MAG: hypothetical protein A2V66_13805 [Ignavibacteria bacterium RBG_13_36_8]